MREKLYTHKKNNNNNHAPTPQYTVDPCINNLGYVKDHSNFLCAVFLTMLVSRKNVSMVRMQTKKFMLTYWQKFVKYRLVSCLAHSDNLTIQSSYQYFC